MRPTGLELLRGVRALLLAEVLPETAAPHLRAQVMLAIGMLDAAVTELDDAPAAYAEERARLTALAAEALPVIGGLGGDDALAEELAALADQRGEPSDRRLSALEKESAAAMGTLGRLSEFCDRWAGDGDTAELGRRVDRELRARVERRLRWTGTQAG